MAARLCLLALVATLPACRGYRGGYAAAPAPLLERFFAAPSLDSRDTMLYEAQVATNIFLFDDFVQKERNLRLHPDSLSQRSTRVLVMPLFRIRQLSDSSAAVRTPSFNPSLRFERHHLRADTLPRVPFSTRLEIRTIRDLGYRVEWTHHSNGQAGCFRSGYVPDETGEPGNCTPGPGADPSGVDLNRANGDFSTTYWGITGFWRHVAIDSVQQVEKWSFAAGLGYQLHRFGVFGDMRSEQRALYGTHRARLDVSARRVFGPVESRIDALYERAEATDPRITPWRAHLDLSVRSPYTLGGGLIVRFLDGQDYYNIGFARRRSRILFGILLDPSDLERPR